MTDEVKTSEDAAKLLTERSVGELAEKLGIKILELSAERSVATMPVEGNTQPFGVLQGGAHVVLDETLGSMSANVWAYPDRLAVGIEVNASHSRSAVGGLVTGTCTALNLGKSLTVHEIVVTDEQGRRLSTVRITNFLREKPTR